MMPLLSAKRINGSIGPSSDMSRRVAMFQILYNPVIVATFVALFLLELWSGVPLMKALLLTIPLEQPIGVLGMLSELLVLLPFMLLLPFMARLYSRLWPDTPAEVMSRAAHIHSRRYGDINTALHLVALEQRRVFPACHRIWMPCVCGAK